MLLRASPLRPRIAAIAGASLIAGCLAPASTQGSVGKLRDVQLAGQRIVTGFKGETPPGGLVRRIRSGRLAGVALFSGNFDNDAEARRLIHRLQSIPRPPGLRRPLLIMVDQEGGQVKRLSGPPRYSAREMGARGPKTARAQGKATARNLLGAGVNVDLAPVFDVARPGSAIEREGRAFGRSARRVRRVAGAFAAGLRKRGVVPTAKHFPGFGAAKLNTDSASQRIGLSRHRLRTKDEVPYKHYVKRGASMVMLSVATYPAFSHKPAALSRSLATHELRGRLGFRGVSITDSLDSAAARATGNSGDIAIAGARAGADILLFGNYDHAASASRALRRALHKGRLRRGDFRASVSRELHLRADLR